MAIPLKSWFTVFNAIGATETARIPSLGAELPEYANSIILEIVGASTPSWTLDIQGRTHQSGTYVAIDYVQVWQAGAAALANAQLSITDTTRRFYLIPNCPSFLQLIATRTTGTLTVRGSYTSEVFSQWLLTTARGSIYVEGPAAHDAAAAGNPVLLGAEMDDTSTDTVDEGDVGKLRLGTRRDLYVQLRSMRAEVGISGLATKNELQARTNDYESLATFSLSRLYNGGADATSLDAQRNNVEADNYIAASLVSATQNGADRTNYNAKGLLVMVDVTARNGTSTITIAVQTKDGNGNYGALATAAAALSAVGQARYLLYPTAGVTGVTEHFQTVLASRIYRVIATYGGSDTISFDVDVVELMA